MALFKRKHVELILQGRKTQTRRMRIRCIFNGVRGLSHDGRILSRTGRANRLSRLQLVNNGAITFHSDAGIRIGLMVD